MRTCKNDWHCPKQGLPGLSRRELIPKTTDVHRFNHNLEASTFLITSRVEFLRSLLHPTTAKRHRVDRRLEVTPRLDWQFVTMAAGTRGDRLNACHRFALGVGGGGGSPFLATHFLFPLTIRP